MNNNIIETRNLVKEFKIGDSKIVALNKIDFNASKGELISLVGPSGSGKTTLLNILGGLDRPTEGSVVIDGLDITKLNEDRLSNVRRDKFGFIFQLYNLIPVLTAIENVELPCLFTEMPAAERRQRAKELLNRVGLTPRINHKPTQLSGGEQQRVTIARALMNNPIIVFADEPTGNVDGQTGRKIIDLLKEINKERQVTIILSTHDLNISKMANRTIHITDGRIVEPS